MTARARTKGSGSTLTDPQSGEPILAALSLLRASLLVATALALAVAGKGGAADASVLQGRSLAAPGRMLTLALTGRHVAFAVGTTRTQCPQVQLWLTESNTRHRFPWRLAGCKEGPSTGFGIPSVAVAKTRIIWLAYIGGNLRDWMLWTATPTRKKARQLRFVERDVDAPAPIVLGPGTAEGVPFAVDNEIVYLGDDGRAIFKATVGSPVRALAAGAGPAGLKIAALLANGSVVGLDRAGREVMAQMYPAAAVTAVRVMALGVAVQVGSVVQIVSPRSDERVTVRLPARSTMLDAAQRRILHARAGDLWAVRIAGGRTTRVVDATAALPAYGQIEQQGLAWSRGSTLRWQPGALP